MSQRRALTAIALIATLLTASAFAQQSTSTSARGMPSGMMGHGGGTPMGGMMGGGGQRYMGWQGGPGAMMSGPGGMGMMSATAGHVEGRIVFVKAELKITKAEQPLWDAVADAMRANAKNMSDMWAQMTAVAQAPALPEKLAAREKLMQGRLDALHKLTSAVGPFYAALSEAQKKTADQLVLGMGMGGGLGMGPWRVGMRQQ